MDFKPDWLFVTSCMYGKGSIDLTNNKIHAVLNSIIQHINQTEFCKKIFFSLSQNCLWWGLHPQVISPKRWNPTKGSLNIPLILLVSMAARTCGIMGNIEFSPSIWPPANSAYPDSQHGRRISLSSPRNAWCKVITISTSNHGNTLLWSFSAYIFSYRIYPWFSSMAKYWQLYNYGKIESSSFFFI